MKAFQAEHDLANDYYYFHVGEKRVFSHNVFSDEINC